MSGTYGLLQQGPLRVSKKSGRWPTSPTASRCAAEDLPRQQELLEVLQEVLVGQVVLQQEVLLGIEEELPSMQTSTKTLMTGADLGRGRGTVMKESESGTLTSAGK